MEVYLSSIDLMRVTFLLGAVLALVYKKVLGVTPGGIIVPGIIVGTLMTNFKVFLVLCISTLLTWLIYRLFFTRFALNKRWASISTMSISVVVGLVAVLVSSDISFLGQEAGLLSLVVPGLVTISASKYSFGKVVFGALVVSAISYLAVLALAVIIPYGILTWLTVGLGAYVELSITNPFLVFPVSILTAALLYYKFGIRSGGYLVAPFIAAVALSSPVQALLIGIGVLASYSTIQFMLKNTLIIGLERFVFSLFCAYIVISLIDLLAVTVGIAGYRPAPIILIIAVAVLTNDLSLQHARTTLFNGLMPSSMSAMLARVIF